MSQGNSNDEEEDGETVSSITDGSLGMASLSVSDGTNRKRRADQPIQSDMPSKLKVSLFQNEILL